VLPRSGAYLLQVNGAEIFVDSGAAILTRPGDELLVAHPLGCEDVVEMQGSPEPGAEHGRRHRCEPVDGAK
jgi:hypothetical protein